MVESRVRSEAAPRNVGIRVRNGAGAIFLSALIIAFPLRRLL